MITILLAHNPSKYGKEPDTPHMLTIFVHSPKTGKDVGCPQSSYCFCGTIQQLEFYVRNGISLSFSFSFSHEKKVACIFFLLHLFLSTYLRKRSDEKKIQATSFPWGNEKDKDKEMQRNTQNSSYCLHIPLLSLVLSQIV